MYCKVICKGVIKIEMYDNDNNNNNNAIACLIRWQCQEAWLHTNINTDWWMAAREAWLQSPTCQSSDYSGYRMPVRDTSFRSSTNWPMPRLVPTVLSVSEANPGTGSRFNSYRLLYSYFIKFIINFIIGF